MLGSTSLAAAGNKIRSNRGGAKPPSRRHKLKIGKLSMKSRAFKTGQIVGYGAYKVVFDYDCGFYTSMVHFLGEPKSFLTYRCNLYPLQEDKK